MWKGGVILLTVVVKFEKHILSQDYFNHGITTKGKLQSLLQLFQLIVKPNVSYFLMFLLTQQLKIGFGISNPIRAAAFHHPRCLFVQETTSL